MVDCDYFTDFNKDLTIENNRILLEFKKSNYCLEMYLYENEDPFLIVGAGRSTNRLPVLISRR